MESYKDVRDMTTENANTQEISLYDNLNKMIDFREQDSNYLNSFRIKILLQEDIKNDLEDLFHLCKTDLYIQFLQDLIYFTYHQPKLSLSYKSKTTRHILRILASKIDEFYLWIDAKEKYTILNSLCTNGDLLNIKYLMCILSRKYKDNPEIISEIISHTDKNGITPIMSACMNNHTNIVKYISNYTSGLFGTHSKEVRNLHYTKDKFGNTLFLRACFDGNIELMDVIFQNFANYCGNDATEDLVNYFSELNKSGFTSLNMVCGNNYFHAAEYLIELAVKVYTKNIQKFSEYISISETRFNFSPLINACKLGNIAIAELIINIAKILYANDPTVYQRFIRFKTKEGFSALDSAYVGNHLDCMMLLLKNGADLKEITKIRDFNHFSLTCQMIQDHTDFVNNCNYFSNPTTFIPTLFSQQPTNLQRTNRNMKINESKNACISPHFS